MSRQSYRDLLAWQEAMNLVDAIYTSTRGFPEFELFALTIQMRKAAVSIPSNIAEGHGRFSLRDFRQFLRRARGSAHELETQVMIATRQRYIEFERERALLTQAASVIRLVNGLIRSITERLPENREPRTENREPRTHCHHNASKIIGKVACVCPRCWGRKPNSTMRPLP